MWQLHRPSALAPDARCPLALGPCCPRLLLLLLLQVTADEARSQMEDAMIKVLEKRMAGEAKKEAAYAGAGAGSS
jgi:hypothetical protein